MGGRDFLMKRYKTANRIFLASAILFGIAIGVHCFCENPLTGLFYFLAQSCLIGCFADWFAVEALFRNRLHLPLFKPLIPANREAVLWRLQETVEGKLVGKETFTDLLKNFSLIQFIEKEAEGSVKDIETDLARSGGELLLGLMENHKKDLSRWIRQGVDNVRVSLGFYLREKALEGNYTEQFLDKLLEEAQRAVKSDQMKQVITNKLEKLGENRERGFLERLVYSFAKFTNTVDYEDMAEAFLAALSERIELWRVDIHPFHKTLLKEWNAAVEAFLKTEEAEKALVHFAEELYQSVSVEEKADALYNSLYEKWAAGDQFEKCFVPKLRTMLHNALRSVAENKELRTGIDESARALGGNILEEEYPHISSITADILKKFKDSDLNEFIEAKVHKELEGIRINGAVVGLAAGAALYGLIEYLYLPFISLLFSL